MMNSMGGDDLPDLDGADEEVRFLYNHLVLFVGLVSSIMRERFFRGIKSRIMCMWN